MRWVKLAALVAAILILAAVAVMLVSGDHVPRRHGGGPMFIHSGQE